ncbi:spore coat U domain-containing protein [Bordetella pseudohinzii]|uniref:Spore coat protein U n=2 Tax=Bordetella pseudohinzii TaxID=1331258 RepID=A0ABM6DF67_9BORD|nr:spore coat U domain-containing protein [Bordetella pseudohinzii]ANY16536.1 spore coat protein U [Bordetella pseudohinzii]KMM27685.1 Spore coat U domain protein [Bordetella pseudohinzii]KXA81499.1 spore coat protein U [Bordetella pseudohinzii]KXA82141.1 spore coat protein U [Bordetella pseudohinzii]
MYGFRWLSRSLVASAIAATTGGALAQTQTGDTTFQVRITIQGTCLIVSATDIDFGTHPAAANFDVDQIGTIQVQCTKDLPFTLGLDGGTTSGDPTARAMLHSSSSITIPYRLSHDAGRTQNWGNDSTSWYSGIGLGMGAEYTIPLTVYARTTMAGNEPVGNYLDIITATITY